MTEGMRVMQLDVTEREDGISQVALVGKLDLNGLHDIELKFYASTAARKVPAIVDLSGVDYIASLGIGMLISCAQSLQQVGQTMVMVGAQGVVDTALRTAGIDQAIPMVATIDDALATIAAR